MKGERHPTCGPELTQDDTDQLECVIGYATSLYLVVSTAIGGSGGGA